MQRSHSSQGEQQPAQQFHLSTSSVYTHTLLTQHSQQLVPAANQRASALHTFQPLSPPANEKPGASNSSSSYSSSQSEATRAQQHCSSPASAAGKQSSILEVQFSITDNLTAVKSNATVISANGTFHSIGTTTQIAAIRTDLT